MPDLTPSLILTRPQMGENIGAAARAMLNFNLTDLRLVAPRDGWPNQAAVDMSSGALDILPQPGLFDTLPDALADCHYTYATSARTRDMVKAVMDLETAMKDAHARRAQGQKIAFILGPERTGLENDDIALCNALIHIPTNPAFSSLNLGQCALLLCSTWGLSNIEHQPSTEDNLPATQDNMSEFLERLESELDRSGFFRDEGLKPTMVRNIKNIFTRGDLTDQEVRTLHGILSALIGNKKSR
ncbi:MAG: RNA methyltransferase [Alphaproteobacteria bacterium]|nr:RNA methyltransferase [Alphaproteobacteria bacterium]